MLCPNCDRTVSDDVSHCPHCHYPLSAIRSFDRLSQDLGRISLEASSLFERLQKLQTGFDRLKEALAVPKPPEADAATREEAEAETTPDQPDFIIPEPPETSPGPSPRQSAQEFEIKLGQKWLLIVGVVLTVLAVGWFLKYSFEQNWIGPVYRVALAYLAGVALLGCGELFRRKGYTIFGLYIIGGGIATLYFSTFAAFQIYDLIPQAPAFAIMILITVLAGTLALVYDTQWIAILGLIGGFLTPIVLSTGQDNQLVLMTYMTILNAGILSIAFFKQWPLLNYPGFLLTWFLFSLWYYEHYTQTKFWPTIVFLNIFFLIYAFVPFAYHTLKAHRRLLYGLGIMTPNAFIGFGYSFAVIKSYYPSEFTSIITLTYAAIFLWMAQFIYRRDREQIKAFIILIGQASLFLVLTVPILFSGHWVTVFWAVQSVALFWASLKLRNRWLYNAFRLFLLFTLAKFFLYDYSHLYKLQFDFYFRGGYSLHLVERLIASAVLLAALVLSSLLPGTLKGDLLPLKRNHKTILWGLLGVTLFLILNVEIAAFFFDYAPGARFASISVLWTVFSIALMALGFRKNLILLRRCSIILFAITTLKVFFIDMSNVSTPYRVVSFMTLGLVLIGVSYLYHRFKSLILPPVEAEENET